MGRQLVIPASPEQECQGEWHGGTKALNRRGRILKEGGHSCGLKCAFVISFFAFCANFGPDIAA